jgi:O-antigen ligase
MLPLAFGIFQTASNGALLGLIGGCATAVVAYRQLRRQRALAFILIAASIGVAVLGIGREDLINGTYEMMSGKRGEIGGAALKGAEERVPLWIASAQVFSESPIGVGPNNFDDAIGPLLGNYHGAHSEYVGMLIERGPLGFGGWCAMLVSLLFALRRMHVLAAQGFRPFAIEPLYGALGALGAQAFVIELFHFRHFWLLLALVFAVDAQASRSQSHVPATERRAPTRARMLEAA